LPIYGTSADSAEPVFPVLLHEHSLFTALIRAVVLFETHRNTLLAFRSTLTRSQARKKICWSSSQNQNPDGCLETVLLALEFFPSYRSSGGLADQGSGRTRYRLGPLSFAACLARKSPAEIFIYVIQNIFTLDYISLYGYTTRKLGRTKGPAAVEGIRICLPSAEVRAN